MTDAQWDTLLQLVRGDRFATPPVGLLVDGPWISAWCGVSLRDYYGSDGIWLDANLKVVEAFPDVLLLAGFWGEYGMNGNPRHLAADASGRKGISNRFQAPRQL